MKITRVQSFLLSYVFPEPVKLTYYGGERTILKRDAMLVRVEGDAGLIGYGPGQGSEAAHHHIRDTIAPFLEGRHLADPDALRAMFLSGPGVDPELFKIYCLVEVALFDLLGKELGVPVSELVGGRIRDSIRLYGSAGMYQPPEGYAAEAAAFADLGFQGYKMRPALGPEEDLRTIELMREAVGPAVDLMIDAHSWWRMGDRSYTAETVHQLAREMGTYDIAWLEEPLPPDDHAAYRTLRETGYVPIASGEHEPSPDSFADLIATESVDFVQMDVVCQGGYTVGHRVLSQVQRHNLAFAFHCWGTDLEVIAAAHLGVCWPENVCSWLEYAVYTDSRVKSMYEFPLATAILRDPLEIRNGQLTVSKRPGFGVEIDESVIERYPWSPGPVVLLHADLAQRNLRRDERPLHSLESSQNLMWPFVTAVAVAGAAWAVRGRSSQVFAPGVWRGNRTKPQIALTFDDGPSTWTPQILDILNEHNAKATFFQVGSFAQRHPEIAREVSRRGHEIGNHTYTHARLYLRSPAFIRREIENAQTALADIHNERPRWFRATYGCRWFGLAAAQKELGLTGVMWTAIGLDWKLGEDAIANRLLAAASNGAIFCLHDGRAQQARPDASPTVGALKKLLPELRQRGYRSVTLSEILE